MLLEPNIVKVSVFVVSLEFAVVRLELGTGEVLASIEELVEVEKLVKSSTLVLEGVTGSEVLALGSIKVVWLVARRLWVLLPAVG